MNKQMLEAFMSWGDRANRDTSHLMDIAIAGAIDQLVGHGTVVLRPARLEEIVSRIGPRQQDADGGWRVTLLPDPRNPVTKADGGEETSAEIASLAGRILNLTPEQIGETGITTEMLLGYAKRLAGSALTQRPDGVDN